MKDYIIFEYPKLKKGRKVKTILLIDNTGTLHYSEVILLKNAKEIIKGLQEILDKEKNGKNI